MSCLFCDQTPETRDAREKLGTVAELLNCSVVSVVMTIQSLLIKQTWLTQSTDALVKERDYWREETIKLKRYEEYRDHEARRLPTHYGRKTLTL